MIIFVESGRDTENAMTLNGLKGRITQMYGEEGYQKLLAVMVEQNFPYLETVCLAASTPQI